MLLVALEAQHAERPPGAVRAEQVALLLPRQGLARLAVVVLAPLEELERQQRLQPTGPCPWPLLPGRLGRHPWRVVTVPALGPLLRTGQKRLRPVRAAFRLEALLCGGEVRALPRPPLRRAGTQREGGGLLAPLCDPPLCDNGPSIGPLLQLHPPAGGSLAPYPPV